MNLPCIICIIVVLMVGVAVAASSKCPRWCDCAPKSKTAVCGETKPGMKTIPSVLGYVRYYTFVKGNIPVVNRSMLSPLSNQSLLSLALINDGIVVLSEDAFTDFPQLVLLDLSENKIMMTHLKSAFRSLGYQLQTIILRKMNIGFIPKDLLKTDQTQNITKLDFKYNTLTSFDDSICASMPQLSILDLRYNHISNLSTHNLTEYLNVRHLLLSNNWLREIPKLCWPSGTRSTRYPRLLNLDVASNPIISLNDLPSSCLYTIQKLMLSDNMVSVLPNNSFSHLPLLYSLELSRLPYLKTIEELAFNSSSLSILYFDDNVRIKQSMFPGKFPFIWAPKLSKLSLQQTRIVLSLNSLKAMLLQLKFIKHLNLQRTRINTIPPRTLCYLPLLKILDLEGNYLAKWDDETFSNVTQLEYLNLGGNRISVINERSFPVEMRIHLKTLNLGNNDFLCTCALLWFRNWMKQVIRNKTIHFVNYPHRYTCTNPTRLSLDKFNPTVESCKTRSPYVIAFVSTGSVIVIFIVGVILVYNNRWNIRYCMYTMRRRQYRQLPGRDVQIKYDVFVSYDSEDSDWMTEEVSNFLENDLKLKVCNHEKNFEGGKMIIDNIVDCMDQSEKILLIVSNNFARSNWCKCEVKLALSQQFETNKDVIVIIREIVARKYMFKSLKALLATTTYIEWNEDQGARIVFRGRLKNVLGCQNIDK